MRYALILFAFALCSCEKFDNSHEESTMTLPPYTTSGNMTFGFRYNDTIWTNLGKSWNPSSREWEDNILTARTDQFGGERAINVSGQLTLAREGIVYRNLTSSFRLIPDTPLVRTYQVDGVRNVFTLVDWQTNRLLKVKPGFVMDVTRLDTIAKIFSGTFSGTLVNENQPADTVKITEGRFDVKIEW